MDPGNNVRESHETASFGRQSISRSSSLIHSLSLSHSMRHELNDDIDSENVSEAGDIGDRSLQRRHSIGRSSRLSSDNPIDHDQEQEMLQSYGSWGRDPRVMNTTSVITPVLEEIKSPLPTKSLLPSDAKIQEEAPVLPKYLEYISCLIHLAVFGILGVITRYLLQKLFGPTVAGVTSDGSILYLDLPSNMVGSFLMGWFGVVFKSDIAKVSEFLAIGLTTGYLGSLTTFSGWNQKMLELSVNGKWVYTLLGFLFGFFLAAYSIMFGIETAKGLKWLIGRQNRGVCKEDKKQSFRSHIVCLSVMLVFLVVLLSVSGSLLAKEVSEGTSQAELWLGCLVAAPGVWLRWFLARLNGKGLGQGRRYLRWVPFGTLVANISAALIMAALATLKKSVKTRRCDTVATSIQLGFLGCLSTVSTLMAELNAMRESKCPWRGYVYVVFTFAASFVLGIAVYAVPVWASALH